VTESSVVHQHLPTEPASGRGQPVPERAELLPGVWRLPLPLKTARLDT